MTAAVAEDLAQIPMSPYLAASLERAAQYASAQAHREVTLEHVLLALAEDPEASVILRSSNIDIDRLQTDVSNFLGNITDRQDPNDPRPVSTSPDLQRILEAAAEAAKQGRRREINGAILLAAIVGDGSSSAAHILRAQGLTFDATIAALRDAAHQQPTPDATNASAQPPAPQPPNDRDDVSTEDALAAARQRVDTVSGKIGEGQSPPSLEPQWEPAASSAQEVPSQPTREPEPGDIAPPKPDAGPVISTSVENFDPAPPAPPTAPHQDVAARDVQNPEWAPPQTAGATGPAAPRLQRVPPPLPPDAGLRPPRSQMPPSPRRGREDATPALDNPRQPHQPVEPSHSPGGKVQVQNAQPPHLPPWVENAAGSNGGRAARPAPAALPNRPQPRSTQVRVETGQLVENIPRKMKTGVSELVEVRIARANVKALAQGLQGGGAAYKHEAMITKAMSVKLRAPDGGFWVEAASPETQWIDNVLGVMTDDFASWRWTVTPKSSGRKKLQLVVSARTVGSDGLAAETALPDQLYDVKVAVNYRQASKRAAVWLVAAVFGGVLARFGEGAFEIAKTLVGKITGA